MHSHQLNVICFISCLLVSGCVTHRDRNPHNDVLIFGTSTKLALDVSAPIQNASIPEFTLGYKRLEAVWMPLKPQIPQSAGPPANYYAQRMSTLISGLNSCTASLAIAIPDSQERAKFCLAALLPADKYVSFSSGVSSDKGGGDFEIDTYSVFASLGAKGGLSFNSASGNLAQFFATGIAAQRLGANPDVGLALNAKAPEQNKKEADAEIEKSKEVQALIEGGASPEEAVRLANGTQAAVEKLQNEITATKTCVVAWNGSPPPELKGASSIYIAQTFYTDEPRLVAELEANDVARKEILKICNDM